MSKKWLYKHNGVEYFDMAFSYSVVNNVWLVFGALNEPDMESHGDRVLLASFMNKKQARSFVKASRAYI